MKKIVLIALLLVSFLRASAQGADIVVLQSARLPVYNSALEGIEQVIINAIPERGQKAVQAHTITSLILSEEKSPVRLRESIIHRHPDCILVIGSSSLVLIKGVKDIPIVYLMVPFPELMIGAQDNISGIDMNIGPDRELEQLTRAAPRVKTIGLLYDPDRTGSFVQKAREYASRNSLSLIALPVKESADVPAGLAELKGQIEWFWMLPDLTVLTPQTVDLIMLFSLENRVPILTFSEKYLDMGAVLAITTDPYDMGRQAGELALKEVNSKIVSGLPPVRVRKVVVRTNPKAAKILGVDLKAGDSGE